MISKSAYFIVGEPSADALGGRLMRSMTAQDQTIQFDGIGGADMAEEGLKSIVPMDSLCVMGIVEIIKQYPRLRRLGFEIIEDIESKQPDCVITIDLPDFNFKVASLLKKRGIYKGKIVHYVAPSVWAWRSGRAKKIAQFLDGLLCLFPFEPMYFTKHGLKTQFIGHSMVESDILNGNKSVFKEKHRINADKTCLGIFFGSRQREIDSHADIFIKSIKDKNDVHLIIPTLPKFKMQLEKKLASTKHSYTITTDKTEKWDAFDACDMALAVSGTVGLELAYAGIRHVIAYKAHPLTALIIKMLIKVKYAHLANILLDSPAIPEFLQEDCNPEAIGNALTALQNNQSIQTKDLKEIRRQLQQSGKKPSEIAASFILSEI